MSQNETYPLELIENFDKLINYLKKHTVIVSAVSVLLSIFGTACAVFNGWDFINAEPIKTWRLPPAPSAIGLFLLLIGIISIYAVNAGYVNKHKLPSGILTIILGATFLISSAWLSNQNYGWNYPNNAPMKGALHPLLNKLAFPFLAMSLTLFIIGIILIKLQMKKS